MVCEICKRGPQQGVSVSRANEKGVTGIWRCKDHPCAESLANQADTQWLTDALEGKTHNADPVPPVATGEGMETSNTPTPQQKLDQPEPLIDRLRIVAENIKDLPARLKGAKPLGDWPTAKAEGVALPPRPTGLGFLDGTMIWRQLTAYMDALESRLAAEIAKNAELEKKLASR